MIRLGYACNNNCVFCHSSCGRGTGLELDTARVSEKVLLASELGAGSVIFTGGEPTIRRDFIEIIKHANGLGLGAGVITNGRMFKYGDFAKQVAAVGLDYALVSLHGPDAETHDAHTGAESFKQTIAGLAAITKLAGRVTVNTVLTRKNAARLPIIARLLENFAPVHFKISLPEPKGEALNNFDFVLPPHDAARTVADFLRGFKPGNGVTVGVDGLTPCLLEDFFALNDDFFTHGIYLASDPEEDGFHTPSHGLRGYTRNCILCSMRHLCPGVYLEYFDKFPGACLVPLKRGISNTVMFSLEEEKTGGKSGRCEWDVIRRPDPARSVAVRKGARLEIFTTREEQTDVAELTELKFGVEQIYEADDEKEKQGRRPAHLTKLQLEENCRGCGKLRLCPGVCGKPRKQPFAELKERMDELAGSLKGRVCDVGCGAGPYSRIIKNMIRAGGVSFYFGIDPEPPQGNKTGMDGKYVVEKGFFEELRWSGEKFDFVTMFRSYQHLADLRRIGSVLSSITGPGSKIIIAEDIKLIEIKRGSPEGGGGPRPGFEHIRNHSARDAADVLREFGFEPEILWEPDRFSAGCWAVAAERKR